MSFGEIHSINLRAQERYLTGLAERSRNLIVYTVPVRLVFLKNKWSRILAALEIWVNGTAASLSRLIRLETD